MSTRILLVEDDTRLSQLISEYLQQQGFTVKVLNEGSQLVAVTKSFSPDVIVLDIMLPGEDGFSLCKKLRQSYQGVLLFLTAKSSDFDHVLGLELGADDYVIKPVEPRVLLARIQALLRRSTANKQIDIEPTIPVSKEQAKMIFGALVIDQKSRQVTLHNELISLTSHEFDMLWMLANHPAQLVERDKIYSELIGREYDGLDRSADVRISRIRKKLHDNPQNPYKIKTIWGKGFYFVPDAWD